MEAAKPPASSEPCGSPCRRSGQPARWRCGGSCRPAAAALILRRASVRFSPPAVQSPAAASGSVAAAGAAAMMPAAAPAPAANWTWPVAAATAVPAAAPAPAAQWVPTGPEPLVAAAGMPSSVPSLAGLPPLSAPAPASALAQGCPAAGAAAGSGLPPDGQQAADRERSIEELCSQFAALQRGNQYTSVAVQSHGAQLMQVASALNGQQAQLTELQATVAEHVNINTQVCTLIWIGDLQIDAQPGPIRVICANCMQPRMTFACLSGDQHAAQVKMLVHALLLTAFWPRNTGRYRYRQQRQRSAGGSYQVSCVVKWR